MNPLVYVVLVIHVITAVALVVFILLHSGKGAGMSSMFGGAMSSASTGTTIIEKNLDRITIGLAILFACTSVILMLTYRPSSM